MHVTACLAGQKVDVEVGEDCRSLQALKEAIVVALPKLWVEGFDVSVGGRALDDDEGVLSLTEDACLDVSANTRGLSTLALREAGREVGEEGLLAAVRQGDVGERGRRRADGGGGGICGRGGKSADRAQVQTIEDRTKEHSEVRS